LFIATDIKIVFEKLLTAPRPAPTKLTMPEYAFLGDARIKVGLKRAE
jgi:hypothetical protein